MSTNDTFLAIFLGSKTSPRMKAWNALSEEAMLSSVAFSKRREELAELGVKHRLPTMFTFHRRNYKAGPQAHGFELAAPNRATEIGGLSRAIRLIKRDWRVWFLCSPGSFRTELIGKGGPRWHRGPLIAR